MPKSNFNTLFGIKFARISLTSIMNSVYTDIMKKIAVFLTLLGSVSFMGCGDNSPNITDEFTGKETTFTLDQASDFPIFGTVTFKERMDLDVQVTVELEGTEGDISHPVHLHYGNLSTPDAEIAVLLNDLDAKTGVSQTDISVLSDESTFRFDDLANFEGSVKIHLAASGDGRNVVLAGGNVGLSADKANTGGRQKIAICKSK